MQYEGAESPRGGEGKERDDVVKACEDYIFLCSESSQMGPGIHQQPVIG